MVGMEEKFEWLVVAGRVRSPTAASELSSPLILGLADRPLRRLLDGRNGHPAAGQPETLNGSKLA